MPAKVLVADDSPTIRRRATTTLSEAGYGVTCVEDGQVAWTLLQGQDTFDVLLCDILMPGLDGYELCRRVKGDARLASLPVLLLRGTFEPWDQAKAVDAGADGYVTKPFDAEALLSTLGEVLHEPGASAPAHEAPSADPNAIPPEAAVFTHADAADGTVVPGSPEAVPMARQEPAAAGTPASPQESTWTAAADDSPFGDGAAVGRGSAPFGNLAPDSAPDAAEPLDFGSSASPLGGNDAAPLGGPDDGPLGSDDSGPLGRNPAPLTLLDAEPPSPPPPSHATEAADEPLGSMIAEALPPHGDPEPWGPTESEPISPPVLPSAPTLPATPIALPVLEPRSATQAAATMAVMGQGGALDDALIERLAERVAARLAGRDFERIAWEVVPDVAEAIIRKRLSEIEAKLGDE